MIYLFFHEVGGVSGLISSFPLSTWFFFLLFFSVLFHLVAATELSSLLLALNRAPLLVISIYLLNPTYLLL